jgi:hypothetical protein
MQAVSRPARARQRASARILTTPLESDISNAVTRPTPRGGFQPPGRSPELSQACYNTPGLAGLARFSSDAV